jgi:hypothetical protein
MRAQEEPRARDATVILPAPTVFEPADPRLAEYERKRAELDAVMERLLLYPPRHAHERGPFARAYDELAERRRALTEEVHALERAIGRAP